MNNVDRRPMHGGQYMFRFKSDILSLHLGVFIIDKSANAQNSAGFPLLNYYNILLLEEYIRPEDEDEVEAPVFLDLKEVMLSTSRETRHRRGNDTGHVVVHVIQTAVVLFRTGMEGVYFISGEPFAQQQLKSLAIQPLPAGLPGNKKDDEEWIHVFKGFIYNFDDNMDHFRDLGLPSHLTAESVASINREHEYHVFKLRLHQLFVHALSRRFSKKRTHGKATFSAGQVSVALWRRLYNEIESSILYKMKKKFNHRTERVFSIEGIRHDLVPRDMETLQLSSVYMLMPILGSYCFAPRVSKNVGIGGKVEGFKYGGMRPLEAGIVLSFDRVNCELETAFPPMSLSVSAPCFHGTFNEIVMSLSSQQVTIDQEKERLEHKWFLDEDTNEYLYIQKVELNSKVFRNPDPSKKLFKTILVAWCVPQFTAYEHQIKRTERGLGPFKMTEAEIYAWCAPYDPDDILDEHLTSAEDVPFFLGDATTIQTPASPYKKPRREDLPEWFNRDPPTSAVKRLREDFFAIDREDEVKMKTFFGLCKVFIEANRTGAEASVEDEHVWDVASTFAQSCHRFSSATAVANAVDVHSRDKKTVLRALPQFFDIKLPFPDARYITTLQVSQAIILHATTKLHKDDPALLVTQELQVSSRIYGSGTAVALAVPSRLVVDSDSE